MPAPATILGYIDKNAEKFIERLAEAVAIPRLDNFHIKTRISRAGRTKCAQRFFYYAQIVV